MLVAKVFLVLCVVVLILGIVLLRPTVQTKSKNFFDRVDPFRGPLTELLIHNWLITAEVKMPGFPLAVTDDASHEAIGLDLTLMKKMFDGIETKWIGVLGEQGFGKTFFSNVFMLLALGTDVGGGRARGAYNSLKRNNNGDPETAPLVRDLLDCVIIDPRQMSLNPLSKAVGLLFDEQYTLIRRMIEVTQRIKLTLEQQKVLKFVMKIGREDNNFSLRLLSRILSDYQPMDEDMTDNPSVGPNDVPFPGFETLARKIFGRKPKNGSLFEEFGPDLRRAAFELKLAIDVFNEGDYFNIFSGESDEVINLLSQRVVSFDMKAIEGDVRSVIELVLGAIQMSAILPDPADKKKRPKHPERIPHFVITDEAYTPWENSFFADAEYIRMKTQREHGIVGMTIFHRLRDLQDAIINPEAAKKAANSLNEIKVWALFRQTEAALGDIRAFFPSLPDHVLLDLVRLPKGHFWLIVPGQAPVRCFVMGTELMVRTFNTDAANDALLMRWFETGDPTDLQNYLIETTPDDLYAEAGELFVSASEPQPV